ncbi:hypothetical protein AA106556_1325 [Neokomagataea tanensis NBRC 106556]|uniref:Uncharacterized protein n=1 Tax=Neokomagataea tanensis NBRC 106556 TaxID=1223519 RepID=A0ABQ0QJI1_9PROT|nr:hypothetical protein AA106556_1325 [Neokomagataea tanensis NBRC 106556]
MRVVVAVIMAWCVEAYDSGGWYWDLCCAGDDDACDDATIHACQKLFGEFAAWAALGGEDRVPISGW